MQYDRMTGVPREPQPPLPAGLAQACNNIGYSHVRAAILRHLAHHEDDGATMGDIRSALGGVVSVTTIHRHLTELESAGLIAASAPPGDRGGQRVIYRSNVDAVREQLAAIASYIGPLPQIPALKFPPDDRGDTPRNSETLH